MRIRILLMLVLVCSISVHAQLRGKKKVFAANPMSRAATFDTDSAARLPIRRVILYSNGVAYVERRGIVTGDAQVNLSFKQSQVDDVLKSMVVLDLGQGKIGAVSYNSSMPASARTAEIPFNIDSESDDSDNEPGGMASVLAQLQGAKVIVVSAKGTATGAILTIEKRKPSARTKDNSAILPVTYAVVIASESGEISSFDLADITSVKLLEENTKHDINEFSSATASTRRRDAKTISITSQGDGQREMVVSYTVAAPIWKTTYRVVLDEEGKPFFQGWAIIDNVSDEDWENVQMSLVSGSPVSFIQNLQKPLYRYRPIIPIPDDLNLNPQVYDADSGSGTGSGNGDGAGSGRGGGGAGGASTSVDVTSSASGLNYMSVQTSVSDALINEKGGIQTAATGSELGDLFEYRIGNPVTVSRNRSALIPIVQTKMDGERISVFNETVRADRPMGGMMLTNTTPLTFEGGSLTVLDRDAYAGEALMERLKPKEQRLISFALDLGTRVSVETSEGARPAQLIKVVNGVFQVHYFKTETKIYHLTNQTDREKIVYVEHPVNKDWGLSVETAKPDIVTDNFYRFRVVLKPFEKFNLPVTERQGLMDSYTLSNVTSEQLKLFITRKYIDDATRLKLERLVDLRTQIAGIDTKIEAMKSEAERIDTDQKRLRENIEALTKTAEAKTLIARYIAKAGEQETRLEEMEKERKTLAEQKDKLGEELELEIKNFEIK
jgi:hypothetical protein